MVEGDEVVFEGGDLSDVFEADDGVRGGGESMLAGVLSGAGLAFRRARAGGSGGIGPIGGELLGRGAIFESLASVFLVILPAFRVAWGGA
jgi:hypothetical protein